MTLPSAKARRALASFAAPQLPPGVTWPAVSFALRTTAASLTALYIAFLMNLDDPKWAAMTVWIVAQGNRGMSVSKGKYRFAGTLIGASVGIALMGTFAQTPEILLPLLALWLGLCTALSTGLRNFRSYGAVLAGYTAVIVVMDSSANPEDVFNIAVARVSYIGLGIVTEAAFAMLFATDDPVDAVRARLRGFLKQSSSLSALALRRQSSHQALHKIFAGALAIDSAAEYAAAISGLVRHRLGHLRNAVIGALLQISAARALRAQLLRQPERDDDLVREAADLLDRAAAAPGDTIAAVAAFNARLDELLRDDVAQGGVLSEHALALHRLRNLMRGVERALRHEVLLGQPDARRTRIRFSSHIDHRAAVINGIRAAVALLVAAAIWIATAWPAGTAFVTIVGVVAALFGTRANPVAGGVGFLKGAGLAVVAATVFNFAVLPAISDFVPLGIVLGIVLIPAGIGLSNPRFALPATGLAIFFLDLVGPDNMARADAATFFNGSIALLLGIGVGALTFRLILPVNVAAIQRRLLQAAHDDLAAIGRHPHRWTIEAWVSRTADRIERRMISGGTQAEGDMQDMLAMMSIGCAAIELAQALRDDAAARKPVGAVMRAIANGDPQRLIRMARLAGNHLLRRAVRGEGDATELLRHAAALLRDIEQTATSAVVMSGDGVAPPQHPPQQRIPQPAASAVMAAPRPAAAA